MKKWRAATIEGAHISNNPTERYRLSGLELRPGPLNSFLPHKVIQDHRQSPSLYSLVRNGFGPQLFCLNTRAILSHVMTQQNAVDFIMVYIVVVVTWSDTLVVVLVTTPISHHREAQSLCH